MIAPAGEGAGNQSSLRFLLQVVLSNRDVGPAGTVAVSGRQAHVRQRRIGPQVDHFGGGVAMSRPVHFVLHRLEEQERTVGLWIVVAVGRVDVESLPPEHLLAAADVADAGRQFLEVVPALGLPEPGIVHREPPDKVFAQPLGRPNAKLRAAMRSDAVANGQNGVEVVVIDSAGNVAISLGLNSSEFPNSCRRIEFAVVENTFEMLIDGRYENLEQVGDQPLRKPKHFVRETDLDPCVAILSLIKNEFAGREVKRGK